MSHTQETELEALRRQLREQTERAVAAERREEGRCNLSPMCLIFLHRITDFAEVSPTTW